MDTFVKGFKTGHRYTSGEPSQPMASSLPRLVTSQRNTRTRKSPVVRDIVVEFRKDVSRRPKDTLWLIRHGQRARCMGLTFDEAFSVVRAHIRKLRGNSRRGWIKQGLQVGFNQIGLAA